MEASHAFESAFRRRDDSQLTAPICARKLRCCVHGVAVATSARRDMSPLSAVAGGRLRRRRRRRSRAAAKHLVSLELTTCLQHVRAEMRAGRASTRERRRRLRRSTRWSASRRRGMRPPPPPAAAAAAAAASGGGGRRTFTCRVRERVTTSRSSCPRSARDRRCA